MIYFDFFNAIQVGDFDKAGDLQEKCTRVWDIVSKFSVIGIKRALFTKIWLVILGAELH
jgi:dihydrodipicolinate synthase/N-acetylneuraminate lyase